MADRKCLKEWLHISKCGAEYRCCNICEAKCKTIGGNTSNLRKHLVKHRIFVKAEECTIFVGLRSTAITPAFGALSTSASVSNSSSAASNLGEEMFETTEMLQYKQLDVVLIYSLKFIHCSKK
ncbi:hypothetical protein ATANTOWER_006788 [Ataeniobius toweri]|uniref:BED-type domain-containing protein n=1 Tax=Ataeniobius toweri TaxID=208326 RepID=A0ABU7BEN8_9TELE|nr:hypothetical protein [Ataeniobius toweri]